MRGATIGEVVATKSSKVSVGNFVTGTTGWTELAIMAEKDVEKVDVRANGKVTDVLGVLGTFLQFLLLEDAFCIAVRRTVRLKGNCSHKLV